MSGEKKKKDAVTAAASLPVPRAGAARKVSFLPVRASFDAASRAPEASRHWRGADALSADAALSPDVRRIIISRARYEVANNGYASGILQTLADDAVGTGPRLQLSICDCADETIAEDWELRLGHREKRWKRWCKAVDLCRKLKIARRAKAQDGEVFLRKTVNPRVRDLVKLDVTLFESEQVGSPLLSVVPDYYDNGVPKEVDGVTFDVYGNESGYRFWTLHPGANGVANTLIGDSYTVSAENVIHYANIVRPGQHRGLPEIASTLPIFNDLRRFTNAVLAAAETAAEISFLLSTDTPAVDDEGEQQSVHLDPGLIVEFCRNSGVTLPEGWKATQLKAEQPTSNHTEFVRTKIREASRALSMPLNVALGDSSGYNYASGRLDHQVYFRVIKGERTLIEDVILDDLLAAWETFDRMFYPEDYPADAEIDHEWMWDGFAHVDPLKEANAQNVRLNNSKTTTLAEECGAEGKDYMKVIRQRVREECAERNLRKKYGLPDAAAAPPLPEVTEDDDDDDKSKGDEKR
jgi:capsid protein